MTLCGAMAATSLRRCECAKSALIVTRMSSEKQISSKSSGCQGLLLITCQLRSTRVLQRDTSGIKVPLILIRLFTLRSKNQICILFRTKYESGPDLILHGQIPCDLCCSHCHEENRSGSHRSMKSDFGHFCLQCERSLRWLKRCRKYQQK